MTFINVQNDNKQKRMPQVRHPLYVLKIAESAIVF